MKTLPYYAVASQQVATHPVKLLKLEATLNASAATLFLQLHDSNTTPAAGAAPLKSWPAGECGFKEFEVDELVFNAGLFLALSTAAATYVQATGASNILDILNVELVDSENPTGTTIIGDDITPLSQLQVWASAAGPKKLISLASRNVVLNANFFVLLFAKDSPIAGDVPIDSFKLINGSPLKLNFGKDGRSIFSIDSTGEKKGCTVAISTTAATLTLPSSATATITAEYK